MAFASCQRTRGFAWILFVALAPFSVRPAWAAANIAVTGVSVNHYDGMECTASPAIAGQQTCVSFTVAWISGNGWPGPLVGATITLADPAGQVLLFETVIYDAPFSAPVTLTLANHSYIPSQSGFFSVTAFVRPTHPLDADPDLSNNTFVSTYEVLPGATNVTCNYSPMSQTIECQLTNAPTGAMYDVHAEDLGPVEAPAFVGTLVGPMDNVSVPVSCGGQGRGAVTIRVLQGQTEFLETPLCFDCAGVAAVPMQGACGVTGEPVPASGWWGLSLLAAFLVSIGSAIAVRNRRT